MVAIMAGLLAGLGGLLAGLLATAVAAVLGAALGLHRSVAAVAARAKTAWVSSGAQDRAEGDSEAGGRRQAEEHRLAA
jgi:hypothetical protein